MNLTPKHILVGLGLVLALLSYFPGLPTLGLGVILIGVAILVP